MATPLDLLKKKVSAKSTAGKLRDRDQKIKDELRKAGVAKNDSRTKKTTRMA